MTKFKAFVLGGWYATAIYSGLATTSHLYHFDKDRLVLSAFLFIMAILTIKALWQQNKNES